MFSATVLRDRSFCSLSTISPCLCETCTPFLPIRQYAIAPRRNLEYRQWTGSDAETDFPPGPP
jgi:hypothetical protein